MTPSSPTLPRTWLRLLWSAAAVVLALGSLTQGCTCAQNVVIPGWDGGTSPDGTGQTQEQTDEPSPLPDRTNTPDPDNRPDRRPDNRPDNPNPETPNEAPDATAACPNPNDIVCSHCKLSLGAKERVILLHSGYLLTQEAKQLRVVALARGCQKQRLVWPGIQGIMYTKADPDSSRVLLLGTEQGTAGQTPPLRLAIFDLSAPNKPLRELPLPKDSFQGAARSRLEGDGRRGVLTLQVMNGTPLQVYIHYQMRGAHLVQMKLPDDLVIYPYSSPPSMFSAYEIYVLQATKTRTFPLAIWSVAKQEIVRIQSRAPNTGVPQAVFASSTDLFTLEIDPKDRAKRTIEVTPLQGGNTSTLAAPGCTSFVGDNAAGIFFCMAPSMIYRYKLPDKTPLSPLQMNISPRLLAYDSGKAFVTEQTKATRLWSIDLRSEKPKMTPIASSLPGSVGVPGPYVPDGRSAATVPGLGYRVLRATVQDKHRLGILDVRKSTLQWVKEDFPMPAIMGRQTEFWSFYANGFSYLLEPQSSSPPPQPLAFFLRPDTASVFHRETSWTHLYSFAGGVAPSADTRHVQVFGHTRTTQNNPPQQESELLVVHHKHHRTQKLKLARTHRVFHSDRFLVLAPHTSQDPPTVTVLRILP